MSLGGGTTRPARYDTSHRPRPKENRDDHPRHHPQPRPRGPAHQRYADPDHPPYLERLGARRRRRGRARHRHHGVVEHHQRDLRQVDRPGRGRHPRQAGRPVGADHHVPGRRQPDRAGPGRLRGRAAPQAGRPPRRQHRPDGRLGRPDRDRRRHRARHRPRHRVRRRHRGPRARRQRGDVQPLDRHDPVVLAARRALRAGRRLGLASGRRAALDGDHQPGPRRPDGRQRRAAGPVHGDRAGRPVGAGDLRRIPRRRQGPPRPATERHGQAGCADEQAGVRRARAHRRTPAVPVAHRRPPRGRGVRRRRHPDHRAGRRPGPGSGVDVRGPGPRLRHLRWCRPPVRPPPAVRLAARRLRPVLGARRAGAVVGALRHPLRRGAGRRRHGPVVPQPLRRVPPHDRRRAAADLPDGQVPLRSVGSGRPCRPRRHGRRGHVRRGRAGQRAAARRRPAAGRRPRRRSAAAPRLASPTWSSRSRTP